MTLETIVLALALVMIALIVWSSVRTGSPPTPTSPSVRRAMMTVLPDRLPGKDAASIVELGSGWGGVAFALARRYPHHSVIGYEVSFLPWAVSRLRLLVQPQTNLHFRNADFMRVDLSGVALSICYLMPVSMARLANKLSGEMPAGALVLSNTFAIPGWQPLDRRTASDLYRSPVFLYEITARRN